MARRTRLVWLFAAVPLANLASPAASADTAPAEAPAPRVRAATDPARLRTLAETAEKEKRWEKALDLYLRLYTEHKPTPELRERIKHCLRFESQVRRHRDPAFQQFVISLPVADALNLYAEVVGKVTAFHADRERATAANLFALGLDEFDRAMGEAAFRQRYFAAAPAPRVQEFRRTLREYAKLRPPTTPREARIAVREVVAEAQRQVGTRNGSAIVCEFLCGACAGMDEFTRYVPAGVVEADPTAPSVVGAEMVGVKEGIGYLRIVAFQESTPRELEDAMLSLRARGLRAVLVDLRGNAGGSLPAAVLVAQRFLAGGIIVAADGPAGDFANRVFSSEAGMSAFEMPVVLLVDTKTMSAAEVVAAAWKEHDRAVLVGTTTFGKGVVQVPIALQALNGADPTAARSGVLVLTVANLYGPRGTPLHGVGIVPHVPVADPTRQLDAALAKALELLAGPLPVPMPMP